MCFRTEEQKIEVVGIFCDLLGKVGLRPREFVQQAVAQLPPWAKRRQRPACTSNSVEKTPSFPGTPPSDRWLGGQLPLLPSFPAPGALRYRAEQLGHASVAFTLDVYSHVGPRATG